MTQVKAHTRKPYTNGVLILGPESGEIRIVHDFESRAYTVPFLDKQTSNDTIAAMVLADYKKTKAYERILELARRFDVRVSEPEVMRKPDGSFHTTTWDENRMLYVNFDMRLFLSGDAADIRRMLVASGACSALRVVQSALEDRCAIDLRKTSEVPLSGSSNDFVIGC